MITRIKNLIAASLFVIGLIAAFAASAEPVIHLKSIRENFVVGILSPNIAPVLHIKSGQAVEIDTVAHDGFKDDPVEFFATAGIPAREVLPDAIALGKLPAKDYTHGHVLTGPIYIDSAEPGDMLEVRILKVTPRVPYGANAARNGVTMPGLTPGVTPGLSTDYKIIKFDPAKKTVHFAPGINFPMRPFMGVMSVAPTAKISSRAPGLYGGNMDFEKLQAGSTLYLPVLVEGALFVTGDSHAGQGDGEVNGTAIEASMTPTLQFILHKGAGKAMTAPWAEDSSNYYILGMDPDLNKALAVSIKNTVKFLGDRYDLSAQDAYSLCSTGIDFGIAEAVDLNLVVYGKVPKSYFKKKFAYWAHS